MNAQTYLKTPIRSMRHFKHLVVLLVVASGSLLPWSTRAQAQDGKDVGVVTVSGTSKATSANAKSTNEAVALIPRDILFGNPDRSGVALSPDGKYISYLAPHNFSGTEVMNIFVAPVGSPGEAKVLTKETSRGIRTYSWAFNSKHIVYTQDQGGDENWHVHAVNVNSGEIKDLTPFKSVAARINRISSLSPDDIAVDVNDRNVQQHDTYKVSLETGERTLLYQNDQFVGIETDASLKPRLGRKVTGDGGAEIYRIKEDGSTELLESIPGEDSLNTTSLGFDSTGNVLYMQDSRGRDTSALVEINMQTGDRRVIAQNTRADAGTVLMHPTKLTVQAVRFNYLRPEWKLLDESLAVDFEYLKKINDGDVSISSRTLDDRAWIVAYERSDGPTQFYRYERFESGKPGIATFLFSNYKALENLPLASMNPVVIKSRDGLDLPSYLTLPSWRDVDKDGKPDSGADGTPESEPPAMVLLVHGGPWARDSYGYRAMVQWLANRGYAVLQVNFRGSTGFGKRFVNAGNREWAGKMHDDLIDAVNWAVENKIAKQDRIGIMGGSYGGYATLVGLTFTPEVFACGVDIVGPSNINTLLATIPPYWAPMRRNFALRVGDIDTPEGREFLAARSPITHVERIVRPLLIAQGANDPRVKQSESDQIVEAMKTKGIPVTYLLFPDEGHGFVRPVNNMAFTAVAEQFLAKHLGGRAEPVGEALKKSTGQLKAGGEAYVESPAMISPEAKPPTAKPSKSR